MRLVRLAMCVAAFAVVGKIALSEDIDVRSLQQKLAAQEARLNDLQAKVNAGAYASGSEVEGILSANKNAVLTIGGTVNTRYFYRSGKESGGDVYFNGATKTVPDLSTSSAWFDEDGRLINTGPTPPPGWDPDLVVTGTVSGPDSYTTGAPAYAGNILGAFRTYDDASHYYIAGVPDATGYAEAANWRYGVGDRGHYRASQGDLLVSDAKLTVKIDVNDYFDAFLKIDLQSSGNTNSDNAEVYWVRWKNVCNSGFGLKVGRDGLVFGEGGTGVMGSYAAGGGDGLANLTGLDYIASELVAPLHNNWDEGRYVQITPYWESQDGKFGAELSLYQDYGWHRQTNGNDGYSVYYTGNKVKSRNFGWGSASFRLRFRPVEGLLLSASVANFHDNGSKDDVDVLGNIANKRDNTAIDLAFSYRPAFFNKLNIWGQWIRGWDVNNIDGIDSDAINAGFSFDLNESWTIFAQGDYLSSRGYGKAFNDYTLGAGGILGTADLGYGSGYDKAVAWASYIGLQYKLPYGVSLEAGWKHEQIKWKKNILNKSTDFKVKDAKVKGDTIYAHLGFDF